jgi:hypothetical protein
MKFRITIDCDNDAFKDAPLKEVARILRAEADKIARFGDEASWTGTLLDVNGNRVGTSKMTGKPS